MLRQVGIKSDAHFGCSDIHGTADQVMPSVNGASLRDEFDTPRLVCCLAFLPALEGGEECESDS